MKHTRTQRFLVLLMAAVLLLPVSAQAYTKLEKGSQGAEVTAMQAALQSLGYTVMVDGKYGTDTESVVRSFQRQHGLTADGVAGDKTLTLLYALTGAAAAAATPTPAPASAAASGEIATVYTTGGSLNLRRTASSTAQVITTIPFGAQVTVLQRGSALSLSPTERMPME